MKVKKCLMSEDPIQDPVKKIWFKDVAMDETEILCEDLRKITGIASEASTVQSRPKSLSKASGYTP